jgi:hypothetical protein
MKFEYTLLEEDFLAFQLFNVSTVGNLKKRKRRAQILLPVSFLALAVMFYLDANTVMSLYFVGCAVVFALFYGRYMRWRYKQHYIKQVKRYYSGLFGNQIELQLLDDHLFSQDKSGEVKVKLTEITVVNEIETHFFLLVSNANSLIIPKNKVDVSQLKNRFQELNISINEHLDWAW